MSNVDTLKIYDDLKASGIPEVQAHAQATAIANANRVTPEDLAALDNKLCSKIDKISTDMIMKFEKLSTDMIWMRVIGGAMTITFFAHLFK